MPNMINLDLIPQIFQKEFNMKAIKFAIKIADLSNAKKLLFIRAKLKIKIVQLKMRLIFQGNK